MTTRTFAGIKFRCVCSGRWESLDGTIGIYQMLAGLASEEWQVYRINRGEKQILAGDCIGQGLSMAEAVCDAFKVPFESVFRKHGIASANQLEPTP